MEKCIFCKIVKGEIPSFKVWEDEDYLAFLSNKPINPGHTLVIPKTHTDYFFDLEDKELGDLLIKSKHIAKALKKAFIPKTGRIGIMVAGLEVHHAHLHLIPMDSQSDLNFANAKETMNEELAANLAKIKAALD